MKTIEKSIRINAPASKIYEFLTNPENLPEIWASMIEVSNVVRKPEGGHSFNFKYKMAGFRFNGQAATTKVTKDRYVEVESKVGVISTFRWTYEGTNGLTEIKLRVDYEVPLPLLGKVAESFLIRLNERECEHLLASLKDRMEATLEAVPGKKPEVRASAPH